MALADEIAVKLGLKTTEFRAALKEANADVQRFKEAGTFAENQGLGAAVKGIHHEMKTLHQFLVAGGLFTLATHLFEKGAEYAKNYAGAIDEDVEAMKRLEEAAKGLSLGGRVMSFLAGTMEKFGLAVGAAVYGVDAAADALTEMNEEAQKAFDAKRVKEFTDAVAVLERQRRDFAFADATLLGKVMILTNELVELDEAREKAAAGSAEYVRLTAEIEKKEHEQKKIAADEQASWDKGHLKTTKDIADIVFAGVDGLEPKKIEHAKTIVKVEHAITEEMRAQQNALEAQNVAQGKQNLLLHDTIILMGKAYGESRSPEEIARAGDEALKDLIAKNLAEIQSIENSKGRGATALADAATGFLPQGIVIARLRTDIMRAQAVLDQRSSLRDNAAAFGGAYARSRFGGDPLQYDALLAAANNQKTEQTRTNEQLEDLNSRLAGAGFSRQGSGRG